MSREAPSSFCACVSLAFAPPSWAARAKKGEEAKAKTDKADKRKALRPHPGRSCWSRTRSSKGPCPRSWAAPKDTASRVSVKDGLIGLGSYDPRGGADYGMHAPPRHLFPRAGVGQQPERRPQHWTLLLHEHPMNLICGINPVLEALTAGSRHFDRLLVVKGLRNRRISDAIGRASKLGVPLRFEPREALDRMSGGVPHQGLIAVVSEKALVDLDQLLATVRDPALVVVLDGIEDPRNLGAILRTAEAAGSDGVVLPERHSAGLSETVARASAGGLEHVQRGPRRQPRASARSHEGARDLGDRFDADGQRAVGPGRLQGARRPRVRRRGQGLRRLVRERATTSCPSPSSATWRRSTCPWRRGSRCTR